MKVRSVFVAWTVIAVCACAGNVVEVSTGSGPGGASSAVAGGLGGGSGAPVGSSSAGGGVSDGGESASSTGGGGSGGGTSSAGGGGSGGVFSTRGAAGAAGAPAGGAAGAGGAWTACPPGPYPSVCSSLCKVHPGGACLCAGEQQPNCPAGMWKVCCAGDGAPCEPPRVGTEVEVIPACGPGATPAWCMTAPFPCESP